MGKTRFSRRAFIGGTVASGALAGLHPRTMRAARAADPVTITYWTILDPKTPGPRSQAQNEIIDGFHKANPGIKVDVVAMN